MSTTPAPNAYCVVIGVPGATPLTIVGPFATEDEASAHAREHSGHSRVPATADVLINPANC